MSPSFRPSLALLAVILVAGAGAGAAHAKVDPVAKCGAAKLKLTGKAIASALNCEAVAAKKGLVADPACREAVLTALTSGFAKAETAAQKAEVVCPTEGDAAATGADVAAFVDGVVAAARVGAGPSKCTSKKIATVGQYANRLLLAHAKHGVKPDAEALGAAGLKADTTLAAAFGKLDEKGKDCQTMGDGSAFRTTTLALLSAAVCDDDLLCTDDALDDAQACGHLQRTCPDQQGCDPRTGDCVGVNCCLMSLGQTACVVPIPDAQIPTAQTFCSGIDAQRTDLTLLGVGPQCIGWRAAGFSDCQ